MTSSRRREAKPDRLYLPAASEDLRGEEWADLLEFCALRERDGDASLARLAREQQRWGGPLQESGRRSKGVELGAERERVGADALALVGDRERAGSTAYPFRVAGQTLVLDKRRRLGVYTFLLLLSHYGLDGGTGSPSVSRIFEEVCGIALKRYMVEGCEYADALRFGFPRRHAKLASFNLALSDLCVRVGEMKPRAKPRSHNAKDGKLDLVAWRGFPDRRPGKLMVFGQCYLGRSDLEDKAKELQLRSFSQRFLEEGPGVDPTRAFFTPLRVDEDDWANLLADGGLLFDRCRIAAMASALPRSLRREMQAWTSASLKRLNVGKTRGGRRRKTA